MNETAVVAKQDVPARGIPPGLALTVVMGTLSEKITAFHQIGAAAAAGIYPAGYTTPQRAIAACWGADALGVHPFTFMQGVHVMEIDGKTILEPKWEFMLGIVTARLPGFRWKALKETTEVCEIWVSDGHAEHTVSYTIADATRQGLVDKPKSQLYKANVREGLFKQALKRALKRIGPHVLMGMPAGFLPDPGEDGPAPPETRTASGAEVVVEGTATTEELSAELVRVYGKQGVVRALERCSFLLKEIAGVEIKFKSVREIGPVEAGQIVRRLKGMADAPRPTEPPAAVAPVVAPVKEAGGEVKPDPVGDLGAEPPAESDFPVLEAAEAEAVAQAQNDADGSWEGFLRLVDRGRKVLKTGATGQKRAIVAEGAKDKGKLYCNDQRLLEAAGHVDLATGRATAPLLLLDNGALMLDQAALRVLAETLRDMIREAEKPDYARA